MKKLLILLLSVVMLGCGGSPQQQTATPSVEFVANPSTIKAGEVATLTWVAKDATSVELDGFPDATSTTGVITVSPTTTTTYTIRALAPNAQAAVKTLIITVIDVILPPPPPPPPTQGVVTITINWLLPTSYTDGTPIEIDNSAKLVTEIYMKTTAEPVLIGTDIPLVISSPGAATATVSNVTVDLGVTYYFRARIHVAPDGGWSEFSPEVSHVWY